LLRALRAGALLALDHGEGVPGGKKTEHLGLFATDGS
jgi:hypothetical protein